MFGFIFFGQVLEISFSYLDCLQPSFKRSKMQNTYTQENSHDIGKIPHFQYENTSTHSAGGFSSDRRGTVILVLMTGPGHRAANHTFQVVLGYSQRLLVEATATRKQRNQHKKYGPNSGNQKTCKEICVFFG